VLSHQVWGKAGGQWCLQTRLYEILDKHALYVSKLISIHINVIYGYTQLVSWVTSAIPLSPLPLPPGDASPQGFLPRPKAILTLQGRSLAGTKVRETGREMNPARECLQKSSKRLHILELFKGNR